MNGSISFRIRAALLFATSAACLIVLTSHAKVDAAYQDDIAPAQAQASLVLVEGAEYGTAFAILHRGQVSYFVSSAHLLDRDAYLENASLGSTAAKKTAADWITIYDPYDGRPYPVDIVGDPDFEDDVVVLRVRNMQHRPRPMCLADTLPIAPPFAVASFQLHVLQAAPTGRPFAHSDYFTTYGTTSVAPIAGSTEFQYFAALEKGFSGGPIFDVESGAVIGLVRRSPFVIDPTTGAWVVSSNTRFAVQIDAIRAYLARLASKEPALENLPSIVEGDRTKLVPKLTGALRLVVFDSPHDGTDLSFVYRAYDTQIRTLVGNRFRHSNGTAILNGDTTAFQIGKPTTTLAHICRTSDGDASGVVALRREISAGPGLRTLEARVALVTCSGRVIDSADVPATDVDGKGPSYDQIRTFVAHLSTALDNLSPGNDERLINFAADGLPIADSESRGFYQIRHLPDATYLSYSWAGGTSFTKSGLDTERRVVSIAGVADAQLQTLSSRTLDAMLDGVGSAEATVVGADGNATSIMLVAGDRCQYLWRRKNIGEYTGHGKDETL